MNKVILMGRLTRDPEVRYSQGEQATAIARYTLAVDRRFRRDADQQTADFIGCVAFGRLGEFAEKYLRKGTKVVVTGRIQTGSYTNKDGQKVYTTDVVVEECEFAESKNAGGDHSGFTPQDRPSPSSAAGDGFMNIPDGIDEELPFN
ncbi:MAG: single-stranded DNA-binding protein [Roseburia sp.]